MSAGSREQPAGGAWPRQAPASVCLLLPACGASCSRALAAVITFQEPLRQHVQHWGLGCSAREGAGEAACRRKREQILLCWAGLPRPTAGLPLHRPTHVPPSLTLMDPASTPSTDTPSRPVTGKAVADLPEVTRGSTWSCPPSCGQAWGYTPPTQAQASPGMSSPLNKGLTDWRFSGSLPAVPKAMTVRVSQPWTADRSSEAVLRPGPPKGSREPPLPSNSTGLPPMAPEQGSRQGGAAQEVTSLASAGPQGAAVHTRLPPGTFWLLTLAGGFTFTEHHMCPPWGKVKVAKPAPSSGGAVCSVMGPETCLQSLRLLSSA